MSVVYEHTFTIKVYSTNRLSRSLIERELSTMEFTDDPLVTVNSDPVIQELDPEDAVRRVSDSFPIDKPIWVLRDRIHHLNNLIEAAKHWSSAGTGTDEPAQANPEPAGGPAFTDQYEAGMHSDNYTGPRWTYGTSVLNWLNAAPNLLYGSQREQLEKKTFPDQDYAGDFPRMLTSDEVREHGLTLIDWPGRVPDEELDRLYRFGGGKADGPSLRTEDALRALIEHAHRTATDDSLNAAIVTAWAVYKQRGVRVFGEPTDSLPRLCDIIVFG